MQINYRNALVLALIFVVQCNGMDTSKKTQRQRERARAEARYYKEQKYNDSEYGHHEDAAEKALTQRQAKRSAKDKLQHPQ